MTQKRAMLVLCTVALAVSATPALARTKHHHVRHHYAAQQAQTQGWFAAGPRDDRYPFLEQAQAASQAVPTGRRSRRLTVASQNATPAFGGMDSGGLVSAARSYIGTNPTGRSSLWCGAFMDFVLKRTGHAGGGNLALAYANYGTRVSGPQVGAIAVMGRRGGGHVGVVSGVDASGNPIIISGNHARTVDEAVYPRGRIVAYVMPR